MTRTRTRNLLLFPAIALLFLFLFESDAVRDGIKEALRLSYMAVIPSVFPFAVLSGYIMGQLSQGEEIGLLRPLSRLFALPRGGATCFLIGMFCGFPLGAKCVGDGYKNGLFTKEEAERMLLFCNNTGPAFLVGGIGAMRGNSTDGWCLFFVQFLLVCSVALITRKKNDTPVSVCHKNEKTSFTQSVSSGVTATLTVVGFVLFFSACIGVAKTFLPEPMLLPFACLFEVSTASHLASHAPYGLVYTAFAVCFSGLSVHLQTTALLSDTNLSLKRYYMTKILLGIFASLIFFIFCTLT